ncbi:MAG: RagB/SusD family nutrient uptake outer membrane protein [Prevotella sp.]|jgi:hypothetical protein
MKSNKYILLAIACCSLNLTSCMDNYETLPADEFTEDYLFSRTDSNGTQARQFLNSIYDIMENGHNRVGGDYLDASTDDAISVNINKEPDVYRLYKGSYTASNRISSDMKWGEYYTGIRKVNRFIRGIDKVPFRTTYVNALGEKRPLGVSMKAESRFLRAWFYFQLIRRYGGVPLMGDKVYGLKDNIELPRNSFEQCVSYIVGELDSIRDSLRTLPISNAAEFGHVATKEACMALKSRVLLYAASPLFNGNTLEKDNDLVGYTDYDPNRWKLAADAAREFIDTFGDNGTENIILDEDPRDAFLDFYNYATNPELIFFRQGGSNYTIESTNGPLGFTGTNLSNGQTCPTQNLVDAFPMIDGRSINDAADTQYKYDEQHPYDNRDPRLNYTIFHHGSKWLGTTLQTWQGGVNNPNKGTRYSRTSYFMRKFMGKFEDAGSYGNQTHVWVMFRYTEILLNFAEAENERLDAPSNEVYNAIIQLRKRAGIKKGNVTGYTYGLKKNMTKEEMRKIIQNERRIELAFEEHRFYDIRRWRIAEEVFSKPIQGMHITVGNGQTIYTRENLMTTKFDPKYYLYPIPYDEVIKNVNMKQNPNW